MLALTPPEIFARFVQDQRTLDIPGFDREDLQAFVRYTPRHSNQEGFIQFNDLPPDREQPLIREQIAYFTQRRLNFEWKVYDLDRPQNLKTWLEREGFLANPTEAFLVFPITAPPGGPTNVSKAIRVDVVRDETGIGHMTAVHQAVWPEASATVQARLRRLLQSGSANPYVLYCAYWNGCPAGIGWISFPNASQFAGLHGGAVVPEWRGQGIYTALLHARLREAGRRGYRFLTVDALPASRPILLSQGFEFVCNTHPMIHRLALG